MTSAAAADASNLGTSLMSRGRHAEGVHHTAAAVRLAPKDAGVLYNHGNSLLQVNRDAEASAIYRRVLRRKRTHAPSYNNLCLLYTSPSPRDS